MLAFNSFLTLWPFFFFFFPSCPTNHPARCLCFPGWAQSRSPQSKPWASGNVISAHQLCKCQPMACWNKLEKWAFGKYTDISQAQTHVLILTGRRLSPPPPKIFNCHNFYFLKLFNDALNFIKEEYITKLISYALKSSVWHLCSLQSVLRKQERLQWQIVL